MRTEIAGVYVANALRRGLSAAFALAARPGLSADPRIARLLLDEHDLAGALAALSTLAERSQPERYG